MIYLSPWFSAMAASRVIKNAMNNKPAVPGLRNPTTLPSRPPASMLNREHRHRFNTVFPSAISAMKPSPTTPLPHQIPIQHSPPSSTHHTSYSLNYPALDSNVKYGLITFGAVMALQFFCFRFLQPSTSTSKASPSYYIASILLFQIHHTVLTSIQVFSVSFEASILLFQIPLQKVVCGNRKRYSSASILLFQILVLAPSWGSSLTHTMLQFFCFRFLAIFIYNSLD